MSWFRRWKPQYSDGVIDLVAFQVTPPPAAMGFGRIYNFLITPHGRSKEIGQIELRLGESRCVYYFGHIGYHIDPPYQGHRYALRACRLLRTLLQQAGKSTIVITTDPDNHPSRRTCERLGCIEERTVDVPRDIQLRYEITGRKVRYIWRVNDSLPPFPD